MEGFIVALAVLILAFITSKLLEGSHYRKIREREKATLTRPAVTFEAVDDEERIESAELALGAVVVSVDHFKRFLAGLRMIFGGELRSYSSVIDRGRREAILRMKESCPDADLYVNCRLETSTISNGKGKAVGCVEVLVYSTAVRYKK